MIFLNLKVLVFPLSLMFPQLWKDRNYKEASYLKWGD